MSSSNVQILVLIALKYYFTCSHANTFGFIMTTCNGLAAQDGSINTLQCKHIPCELLLSSSPTDPMDMEKDLQNSKAVLVDIGAPRAVIEAFMEHYVVGQCPLVLVTAQAGCNDRKKQLATQIIDQCGPSTITGSLGDIFAISQEILEKG